MDSKDFQKYMKQFENDVVAKGVISGILGKLQFVSIKKCKLATSNFAKSMGLEFDNPIPFAIDYYGLVKKSTGCQSAQRFEGMQELTVVYFAAIKINHINFLRRELLIDFVDFKEEVLRLRGFKKDK